MFQCLRIVIIISFMVKLTFVSPSNLCVHEVWDYNKANIENIKKAVSNFNWNRAVEYFSVVEKVELLNERLNIFWNYIPNKKLNVIVVKLLG